MINRFMSGIWKDLLQNEQMLYISSLPLAASQYYGTQLMQQLYSSVPRDIQ